MKKSPVLIIAAVLLGQLAKAGAVEDLFAAALKCDKAGVQKALDAGADVNFINPESGQNALAAAFFCPGVTRLLLDKGGDPNGGAYPAIISAANNYSVEVLKMLLESGADANAPGTVDPAAFFTKKIAEEKAKGKKANKAMIAAWEGAASTMKKSTVTALKQTVQQTNCVPCLDLLIKHGANVNEVDSATNSNILFTLTSFGMERQMRKDGFAKGDPGMASYGLKVPDWYSNLPDDINGTSAQMLDLLIKGGVEVNLINSDLNSPLLAALGTGKMEVAKGLVKGGADVSYMHPKHKKDAVSTAAELGDLELLKMLVEKGAAIDLETWDLDEQTGSYCKGFTALARATIYDHYDCAKFLIDNGAKIQEGISGLFSKRMYNKKGKMMMDYSGAIPKPLVCIYKLKNKTPIYFAIENENMELIQLLATSFKWYGNHSMEMNAKLGNKEKKAVCNMAGGGKFTPSRYAKKLGYKETAKYLVSLGK